MDSSCPVIVLSSDEPPCSEGDDESVNVVLLVGLMMAEFVLLLLVFAIIFAITMIYCTRQRQR